MNLDSLDRAPAHIPPEDDLLGISEDGSVAGSDIDRWGNDWGGAGDHADVEYLVIDD